MDRNRRKQPSSVGQLDQPVGVDDAGRLLAIVNFQYPDDVPIDGLSAEEESRLRREVTLRLVQFLAAHKAGTEQVGRRVVLLSYLLHVCDCKTQRDLAKRLGVTPARVSQALNAIKREFSMLAGR